MLYINKLLNKGEKKKPFKIPIIHEYTNCQVNNKLISPYLKKNK